MDISFKGSPSNLPHRGIRKKRTAVGMGFRKEHGSVPGIKFALCNFVLKPETADVPLQTAA